MILAGRIGDRAAAQKRAPYERAPAALAPQQSFGQTSAQREHARLMHCTAFDQHAHRILAAQRERIHIAHLGIRPARDHYLAARAKRIAYQQVYVARYRRQLAGQRQRHAAAAGQQQIAAGQQHARYLGSHAMVVFRMCMRQFQPDVRGKAHVPSPRCNRARPACALCRQPPSGRYSCAAFAARHKPMRASGCGNACLTAIRCAISPSLQFLSHTGMFNPRHTTCVVSRPHITWQIALSLHQASCA